MNQSTWMALKEQNAITKHLTTDSTVLEWGSGGSTLAFAPLVKSYHSIEHDKQWFDQIKQSAPSNVTMYYCPPSLPLPSQYHQSEYRHYREYLDIVYQIGQLFDFVLIDGRARRLCALKVLPFLKPNAVVAIHDWCTRPPYHCVLDYYNLIERVDDTEQTIALFQPRVGWINNTRGYDINLGSYDRLQEQPENVILHD